MSKYNRTLHLPYSPGGTNDDKRAKNVESLVRQRIIITEKMDGSNVCLMRSGCYSRSHAGPPTHGSFSGFKALHAAVGFSIEPELQIFGEWCFALHSIAYSNLPAYFLTFAIRNQDQDAWLPWNEVEAKSQTIGVPTVPVLFDGIVFSEKELQNQVERLVAQPSSCGGEREGVVVRLYSGFPNSAFSASVMKWVRKNHVQTDEHWKNQTIVKNGLA